ncbi:glycosyltransferase family 4 protein [Marinobacter sp. SS21]|uniref:glycosyltransferase family 4 protein n=1 Tax=Marinobacter sp. SS21 TaxID=2979460 RepID=UPI00232FE446|nr:glycosyltransferase family 4 protein [Marinobacter sp. SS21]MDC0664161.1 glycosyltransferase family 4 protein [Marinobacter sp. SS21]
MKVFIIEPVGGHGGMNYYNNGLAYGLKACGAEITLFTCDETKDTSVPGITIVKPFREIYGQEHKLVRAARYVKGLVKSVSHIRRNGGRLCHLHFFQYSLLELFTCLVIRASKIKIVSTVHDVEAFSSEAMSIWQRTIFKLCSELIVHNNYSRAELDRIFRKENIEKRITKIPHGNYLDVVNSKNRAESANNLGLSEESQFILFFGQIKKVKGLDILIRAMGAVLEKYPNAILLIAGKEWKDSFKSYQKLIVEEGIDASVVKHIRYIPDNLVDDYYNVASCVVLPYRKIYQSGVLLMAMSYGCVPVASALEPMKEVIKDGLNGYLFEPGSHSSLSGKIIEALENDRESISSSAVRTMAVAHDWNDIGKQHLSVYNRNG